MNENTGGGKRWSFNRRFLWRSILFAFIISGAVAATVWACGWDVGTEHSVRFNPYRMEKDFGRLPRLPRWQSAKVNRLFSWNEDVGWVDYEEGENKTKAIEELFNRAEMEAERKRDFIAARNDLQQFLQQSSPERISRYNDFQKQRNSAFDMLDALTALEQGSPVESVRAYLMARMSFGNANSDIEDDPHFQVATQDKNLKDNTAYLKAALTYFREDYAGAQKEFLHLCRQYPNSEKREAALLMAALCAMKQSQAYRDPTTGYPEMPQPYNQDEHWKKAYAGFQQLMRDYPQGRYFSEAQGRLAHLWLRVGDRVKALAEYFRMLGSPVEAARLEAVCSLRLIRAKAEEGEMLEVEKILESEPAAAQAYAYYEIYNYAAPDLDYFIDYRSKPEFKATEEETSRRIVAFATRLMKRYPNNATGGAFVLRVAEANLRLDNLADAAKLARRALTMKVTEAHRAEALWVAGVAEQGLKQYKSAREALTTLIQENPNNQYTEGARRNLARLEEDAGNLEAALEQYLALDYRYDTAYFVDVLMKPEQLKQFIDRHPNLKNRDELTYALAVRYLREFRWHEARQIYAGLRPLPREMDYPYLPRDGMDEAYREDRDLSPKERGIYEKSRGLRPQWIEMDLRTANELERLERDYSAAQGDEAKAEALYQLASYIYENSLLFYNALAWGGDRHYLLYDLYLRGAFRRGDESQVLFDYMQNHDMASRALGIYLDTVKKYPNTRAARDALYTAAVCHDRLAEYNNYWRDLYADGGHAGERLVTYRDVKRAYPDYRFPLGTFGWEPATRTVNGGAGWASLPKPKPKLTLSERAVRYGKASLKKVMKKTRKTVGFLVNLHLSALWMFAKFILDFFKCLWFGCAFVFLCMMVGWATEARKLLRDELSRCEDLTVSEAEKVQAQDCPHRLSLYFIKAYENGIIPHAFYKYLNQEAREEGFAYLKNLLYKIRQLTGYERGKSLLAFAAATHAFLAVLLYQVLTAFK